MATQINGNNGVSRIQPGVIEADDFQAALFLASKTANGYSYLPNGLLIQWGESATSVPTGTNAQLTVTFPIAFPNACLSLSAGGRDTSVAAAHSNSGVKLFTKTLNSAVLTVDTLAAGGEGATFATYIAICH